MGHIVSPRALGIYLGVRHEDLLIILQQPRKLQQLSATVFLKGCFAMLPLVTHNGAANNTTVPWRFLLASYFNYTYSELFQSISQAIVTAGRHLHIILKGIFRHQGIYHVCHVSGACSILRCLGLRLITYQNICAKRSLCYIWILSTSSTSHLKTRTMHIFHSCSSNPSFHKNMLWLKLWLISLTPSSTELRFTLPVGFSSGLRK